MDEHYDIAVSGHLHAITIYFEREDLRQYAFSTIAYKCGKKLTKGALHRLDGKIFSSKKLPDYTPEMAVARLIRKARLKQLIY